MDNNYFKNIQKIKFEGKESTNPLAYKYYNADHKVMGKPMREHFKFAMAYWHSMNDNGADPFGRITNLYPWNQEPDVLQQAKIVPMQLLNSSKKWALNIFVFMISI